MNYKVYNPDPAHITTTVVVDGVDISVHIPALGHAVLNEAVTRVLQALYSQLEFSGTSDPEHIPVPIIPDVKVDYPAGDEQTHTDALVAQKVQQDADTALALEAAKAKELEDLAALKATTVRLVSPNNCPPEPSVVAVAATEPVVAPALAEAPLVVAPVEENTQTV